MVEKTKLKIAEQMKYLMRRKSIEKIRVSELCTLADVERSTFYHHFKDKYALVAWIFYNSANNMDVTDLKTSAEHLRQMKQDIIFYKRAFEDTSQNALWHYMLEYFSEENEAAVRKILHIDQLTPQLSNCIRFYCYGAVGMARDWIMKDGDMSAGEFVEMTSACMPDVLRNIYLRQNA